MSALMLPLLGLFALAGGVHLILMARGTFRTWLALQRTPTSSIAGAPAGTALIELTGTVMAPERPVRDPEGGTPCVYYQRGSRVGHCDFSIDDGTGRAHLELAGALVAIRGGGDVTICPGEQVYVLGAATRLESPDPGGATLRLRSSRQRPLLVAELSEHAVARRLALRAGAALTLGGLLVALGLTALLLQTWLLWS